MQLKPLYMWAGGKSRLLKHYHPLLPSNISSYVEPFFGGGALFTELLSRTDPPLHSHINDINAELIQLLQHVATQMPLLKEHLLVLEQRYFAATDRKSLYYSIRSSYWTMPPNHVEASATLYFLMKTSFNGIWQSCVAANGKFATPAGLLNHKVSLFDYDQLEQWARILKNTTISAGSYTELPLLTPASFIFCDPPYRNSHTTYAQSFDDTHQLQLIQQCQLWASQGHTVWLANRTASDATDTFFETHLPSHCATHTFDVTYTAGRRKKALDGSFSAKKAHEFIAIFTPHDTSFTERL